jgi:hypothetical protein
LERGVLDQRTFNQIESSLNRLAAGAVELADDQHAPMATSTPLDAQHEPNIV